MIIITIFVILISFLLVSMASKYPFYLLVMLVTSGSLACNIEEDFVFLTYEQIVQTSPLIVHGKDTEHTIHQDPMWRRNRTDSIFKVFCVLKNEYNETVNETITLHRILPRNSCETMPTFEGNEYIVMLRKIGENRFEWDPIKKMHQSSYIYTPERINKTMQICGLTNPTPPMNAIDNMCPIPLLNTTECPTIIVPTEEKPTPHVVQVLAKNSVENSGTLIHFHLPALVFLILYLAVM